MTKKITLFLSFLLIVAFSGVFFLTLSHTGHSEESVRSDCPFMHHADTICPMTAFDHISLLRGLFETMPGLQFFLVLTLSLSSLLPYFLFKPRVIRFSAFWRWRQSVITRFSSRFLQDSFAQGILNPKVY